MTIPPGPGRYEVAFAVLAPVALAAVAIALLFMTWSTTVICTATPGSASRECMTESRTLLEEGVPAAGWALIAGIAVAVALVPVSAAGDVVFGRRAARIALRVLAGALMLFAFVTGFSIGLFILPSAGLALMSAVFSLQPQGGRTAAAGAR